MFYERATIVAAIILSPSRTWSNGSSQAFLAQSVLTFNESGFLKRIRQ